MKISGSNTLVAPVDQVWVALLDPRVLARCIPGCESLTPTGPHSHIVRVTAGVAAIKGTYDGSVALVDLEEPHALTMKARGARSVDVTKAAENEYAEHCAEMDLLSAPLRDCVSYYNGDGKAKPGSLAYYGGGQRWHKRRMEAQETMEAYVFD